MGEKQHRGWSRLSVIVAMAAFVVAFASFWLTFAIGYHNVNSGFRAWVDSGVASVGPCAARVGSLLVSFCASVLAGLLANWVTHRVGETNWGNRWQKWRTEKHVSASYRAAAPGREELAARLAHDDDAEKAQFEAELRERVRGLSVPAIQALRGLLRLYRSAGSHSFRIGPRSDDERRDQKLAGYELACEELKGKGFLSGWRVGTGDETVVATLAPWVRAGLVLRLFEWLTEELEARGVRAAS